MSLSRTLIRGTICCAVVFAYVGAMKWALGADWPVADMNRTIDQTNFVVNQGCSGTLIDVGERYVLTANHCVTDQYEVVEREKVDDDGVVTKEHVRKLRDGSVSQIEFAGSESVRMIAYKVKLVAVDADKDLALLQVRAQIPNKTAAIMACEGPMRGDAAYVVGNPMGVLYSSVTVGIVSSLQRDYDGVGLEGKEPLMQVSSGVIGGNSGGAVYNAKGEMIGVPVRASRMNEILGFAVPLSSVRAFLSAHKLERLFARCEP